MMLLRVAGATALLALLAAAALKAAGRPPEGKPVNKSAVDTLVRPLIDGGWMTGLAVGLLDEKGARVYGYGKTSRSNGRRPNGDTVFEIGSVTKVFTALLLAEMVERGEVRLDQPLRELLPGLVKVPRHGETEITLLHLATHTSGLPRLPENFAPKDPDNPYADYSVQQMYDFLSGYSLPRKPGEGYAYSNYGAGLLGHALALRAGKSYEALLVERVLRPLGLHDTRVTLDDRLRWRLAPGHDAEGSPVPNWDAATLAGAGALRSTARDMLRFLSASMGLIETELAPALKEIQARRFPADGPHDVALGWHRNRTLPSVWHNGGTRGYHSFVGFLPERRAGVVVLSNTATDRVDDLGVRLLRRMAGEAVEPPTLRKPLGVDAKILAQYVGEYALAPGFILTVTLNGEQLMAQATGQPRFAIYPESETRFFYKVVDAQLTFEEDATGKVTHVILHQGGRDLPGPKTK